MKRSRPTFVGFGARGVLLLGAMLALLVPPAHAKDQAQGQAPELRLGYSSSWAPPWGELRGGQVAGGIHHDVGQALTRRLGWRLQLSRIPQLQSGGRHAGSYVLRFADLLCGMHPSWSINADEFHWSAPLFEIGDVMVGHAETPAPASLAELPKGTRVGTVRGYVYPTLAERVTSGALRLEEAPDQGSVLRKLERRRTPVAVVSVQSLAWHLRQNPGAALSGWRLPVQSAQYHCALPKGTQVDVQAVTQALSALKREGELERILARYAPR